MAFEWDPAERAAFDAELRAHLEAAFPDATFTTEGQGRQWYATFPDGTRAGLWEPNFFFSFPSFDKATLFGQAAAAIAAQREAGG